MPVIFPYCLQLLRVGNLLYFAVRSRSSILDPRSSSMLIMNHQELHDGAAATPSNVH